MSDTDSIVTPRMEQHPLLPTQHDAAETKPAKLSPFVAHRAKRHRPAGALTDNDEFMAAAIGDTAWLKQTLKTGKDPSQYDKNGLAAIHLASLHGRLDCLRLLVERYNVDVNLPSTTGWRSVHLAINNRTGKRSLQCLQYLLDQGADPSLVNDDELTPAHQAAIEGSVKCLTALINAGAKINMPDSKGHLAIDYAKLWGHRKCARILASESWKQDKSTQLIELQKLEELKLLKHQDDWDRMEVKEAEREFYGQQSFTNWLDDKRLDKKSTGPTSHSDCSRHESHEVNEEDEYMYSMESSTNRMATYQPNSVAKKRQPRPAPTESLVLKHSERTKRSDQSSHPAESGKSVRFEELSPKKEKKSPKKGRRATHDDDAMSLHTPRLDSALMPDLPQEVLDRELFNKLSPHERPLSFKCKNIIDAQHRRLFPDDAKPLQEMYAHLSDCADSSLFPSNAAVLLGAVGGGSSSQAIRRTSPPEKLDISRMARTMKQLSKPKTFPSLVGKDYTYGFEVL